MPKIHEISGYISKLYLVEYEHGLLLLDSGCKPDAFVVRRFIETELGRKLSDLKLVVVTHAHPDHSGGASEFKKKGIPVAGPERCNDWYQGLPGLGTYFIDILLTYYVASKIRKTDKYQNVFFSRTVDFDHVFKDQDQLPQFEDWMVVETPGHTECDISLVHKEAKLAYVADNMVSLREKTIRPYPLYSPEKYKASMKKYIDLGIQEYLLAHYGRKHVRPKEVERLIDSAPKRARNHKNSALKIVKRLFGG